MTRSARHRGPLTPRWVRGLLTGALMAFFSTSYTWLRPRLRLPQHLAAAPHRLVVRLPDPPLAAARLERDMEREKRDRVPILDPIPGEFAPASLPRPAQRGRGLGQGPQVQERLLRPSTRPSGTTSGS